MTTIWGDDERFVRTYFSTFRNRMVYSTFDWATCDSDGYYFVLGRTDDVINVAGHRLGTREIEEAVQAHSGIAEVAVVGVADQLKGQVPVAFAVVKDPSRVATPEGVAAMRKEVMDTVDRELGAIARPGAVHFVTVLPKTRSGKLLRRSIQALAEGRDPGDLTTIEDPAALAADADWTPLRYRRVAAAGEYDAPRQILIDNRVHDGRVGYHVVTPLKLADGRAVLVNRGWVAQGASRQDLPRVPTPPGEVTVTGRLAVPAGGYFELSGAAPAGPVWQNLEPAKFAAATGIAVLPAVIEQTEGADALARDWPAPDFGIEKHRIYMMQWYAFAAIAVVLWFVLNLRRPAAR
jgi:cytochrome oxidase assembly protein ShyY1